MDEEVLDFILDFFLKKSVLENAKLDPSIIGVGFKSMT